MHSHSHSLLRPHSLSSFPKPFTSSSFLLPSTLRSKNHHASYLTRHTSSFARSAILIYLLSHSLPSLNNFPKWNQTKLPMLLSNRRHAVARTSKEESPCYNNLPPCFEILKLRGTKVISLIISNSFSSVPASRSPSSSPMHLYFDTGIHSRLRELHSTWQLQRFRWICCWQLQLGMSVSPACWCCFFRQRWFIQRASQVFALVWIPHTSGHLPSICGFRFGHCFECVSYLWRYRWHKHRFCFS